VQAGGDVSPDDWGDFSFDVEAASPDEVYITGRIVSEDAVFGQGTASQIDLHQPEIPAIFLARYDGEGTPAWVATVTASDVEGEDLDIAPDGSVLLAGRVRGGSTVFGAGEAGEVELDLSCSSCPFLASWAASGAFQWVASADGVDGEGYGHAYGVSSFPDGSTCVAGDVREALVLGAGIGNETVLDGEGTLDGWVARFGPGGEFLWARRVHGAGTDRVSGVTTRQDGSCVVSGVYEGSAEFESGVSDPSFLVAEVEWGGFAASWDQEGELIWVSDLGVLGIGGAKAICPPRIAALPDGGLVVGGAYKGSIVAGTADAPEVVAAAQQQDEGNEYSARDLFLARFEEGGEWLWTAVATGGGDGSQFDGIHDIAIMPDGDVLVGGRFAGEKTFGPGEPGETVLAAAGFHYDGFVALYNEDGTLAWALRFASGSDDHADYLDSVNGVAVAGESTIFVTGFFYGTVTFGTGPGDAVDLTSFGHQDIFLARLDRTDGPG
jgi:hypothetical protein